ncbi:MAG TPA: DoxX family protein [Lacunisphaera sp.]
MSTQPPVSKAAFWSGVALAVPPVFMLLLSGIMKVQNTNPDVVKGFADWPAGSALLIGGLEVTCTIIYLIPRTAVLGAILLAGYLGGAVAVTVKMGMGPMAFMPAGFGVLLWGSLWLRDPRVRALVPLRN